MLFGLGGIPSTILIGIAFDWLPPRRRGWLFVGGCAMSAVPLALLAWASTLSVGSTAALLAALGFFVNAPYTLTSTVQMAMAPPELVGTTSGLLDAFG